MKGWLDSRNLASGWRPGKMAVRISQIRVQNCDHLSALADGGGDALHGAGTDVSYREHPPVAGLQMASVTGDIGASEHEPFFVERDGGAGQPTGVGICTDEQEEMQHRPAHLLSRKSYAPADRL